MQFSVAGFCVFRGVPWRDQNMRLLWMPVTVAWRLGAGPVVSLLASIFACCLLAFVPCFWYSKWSTTVCHRTWRTGTPHTVHHKRPPSTKKYIPSELRNTLSRRHINGNFVYRIHCSTPHKLFTQIHKIQLVGYDLLSRVCNFWLKSNCKQVYSTA